MRHSRLDALPSELQTEIIGHLCVGHRSKACHSLSRCSRHWRTVSLPFAFASVDITDVGNEAIYRLISLAATHSQLVKRLAISLDIPSPVLNRGANRLRLSDEHVAKRESERQSLIAILLPMLPRLTDVTIYFHSYWSALHEHREDETRTALKALSDLRFMQTFCLKGKLSADVVNLLYEMVPNRLTSVEVHQSAYGYFAQACADALWSTFLQIPTITSMALHGVPRPSSEVMEAQPRLAPRLASLSFQHRSLGIKYVLLVLDTLSSTVRHLELVVNCPDAVYPLIYDIKLPTFPQLSSLDLHPGSSEMLIILLDLFRHTGVHDVKLHLNDLFHSAEAFLTPIQDGFFSNMRSLTLHITVHVDNGEDSDDSETYGFEWDDGGQREFNSINSDDETSDREDVYGGRSWACRQRLRAKIRQLEEDEPDFDDPNYFNAWKGGKGWSYDSLKRAEAICKVRKVWFTHFVIQSGAPLG